MIELLTYENGTAKTLIPYIENLYEEENNVSVGKLLTSIKDGSFKGWASVMLDGKEVISCAAAEVSPHYTDDISLRFCRYYKKKDKRKVRYNVYPYFKTYIDICKRNNFKIFYFSVHNPRVIKDILNPRVKYFYSPYEENIKIEDFKLRSDIKLATSPRCVQYIFEYKVEKDYDWQPHTEFIKR